jgi:hypothetical protein
VSGILAPRTNAQVYPPVIEGVMVLVMDNQIGLRVHNQSAYRLTHSLCRATMFKMRIPSTGRIPLDLQSSAAQ